MLLMSAAVQVTGVLPNGNAKGLTCVQSTLATATLSDTLFMANDTSRCALPGSVKFIMALGHVMLGFSTSKTVTAKEHEAKLRDVSRVVHVTIVGAVVE